MKSFDRKGKGLLRHRNCQWIEGVQKTRYEKPVVEQKQSMEARTDKNRTLWARWNELSLTEKCTLMTLNSRLEETITTRCVERKAERMGKLRGVDGH